jgi:hypothetical protein
MKESYKAILGKIFKEDWEIARGNVGRYAFFGKKLNQEEEVILHNWWDINRLSCSEEDFDEKRKNFIAAYGKQLEGNIEVAVSYIERMFSDVTKSR